MSSTWRRHSDDLNGHLAQIVTRGGTVRPADLDAALHARTAVLLLALDVLFEASALPRHGRPSADDARLPADPVAHLARLLQTGRHPHPQRSLTDTLGGETRTGVGRLWRDVGRDAALAHHELSRLGPHVPQLGEAAPAAIHEAAQFTTAITWLDEGLAVTCRAAGRDDDAELLLEEGARLRPIAASVAAMGVLGPLPDVQPPRARAAIVVRDADAVAPAIDRLGLLLRSAQHVGPTQVQDAYWVLGSLVGRAAAALEGVEGVRLRDGERGAGTMTGRLDLVDVLQEHSWRLYIAGRTPGRVQTLLPRDGVVAAQTDFIRVFAGAHGGHGAAPSWTASPGRLRQYVVDVAAASSRVTSDLHSTVVESLRSGAWLVPAGEEAPARLIWTPAGDRHAHVEGLDAPTLLKTSRVAAEHALRLAGQMPEKPSRPVMPGLASRAPIAGLLAEALKSASSRSASDDSRLPSTAPRRRR